MVRLNRNKLNTKQLDDLFQKLASTIAPQDPKRADEVLRELMGSEERIMLAKRLAAAVLLVEGVSMYRTGQLLKLSQSTVGHIAGKLECGQFDRTLRKIAKTKKDYFSFLEALDNVLHLGGILPHYNGLDRYKHLP